MAQPWYATREDLRSALGSASTARSDAQVDRALEDASKDVDKLCHRVFAPVLGTRYFDWPSEQTPRSWRLWLDQNDLIAATLILSAGVEIPPTDYYLEPANDGPPYRSIETRLDRPSVWDSGDTHQRAIAVTGWWGYADRQIPAGLLVGAIDAVTTSVTVTDSTAVGVGDLVSCGAERMVVTDKALVDTGQILQTPLAAKKDAVLLQAEDGTAYRKGEILTIGAESVEVRSIAGNMLTVERAYDGTLLDSHSGDAIWAPRLLTVERGAAGTTAATAADGAALTRWRAPAAIRSLTIAEAQQQALQEQAGYARTVRSQQGSGTRSVSVVTAALDELRQQVYDDYGRKARTRAV